MSRKYKFLNPQGIYFVSFATVYWIDVFVREIYFETMVGSLKFCREHKGLELFAYCIMPSHVHLIFRDKNANPGKLIKEIKTYTSKTLQKQISENVSESRKEWMLWMFKKAGSKKSNVKNGQFWQQNNQPIELWSNKIIDLKIDYVHNNPVKAGFVSEPRHWKYSSAKNYAGEIGVIDIDFV